MFFNIYPTEAASCIVMSFVGAAATLAIVFVVFGLFLLYKRRRQRPSKLSAGAIESVEMKNKTPPDASQDNQVPVRLSFSCNFKNT